MNRRIVLMGALLAAAPLLAGPPAADPRIEAGRLAWFALDETREQIAARIGAPALVAPFGADFIAWQYKFGTDDHDGFSHFLVFRKSDGKLAMVTRNFDEEQPLGALFPDSASVVCEYKEAGRAPYSVRVRRLEGGRVLLAMGAAKAGDTTTQIVMARVEALRYFFPWLHRQLTEE
jgi:hypothetical protein